METKELKIRIPEGYEIDESKSTFEKIVFKKKDDKPRSWEKYLCSGNYPDKLWFVSPFNGLGFTRKPLKNYDLNKSPNYMGVYLPSKELAEAFLAMMQLMSLRQAWIGDWKPNWDGMTCHYCIVIINNKYDVNTYYDFYRALSFPTKEMAIDFMNTFKDLLEIAKSLI